MIIDLIDSHPFIIGVLFVVILATIVLTITSDELNDMDGNDYDNDYE